MNISRAEQRVLHVLAQGGRIEHLRGANGKIAAVICRTHDGAVLADLTLALFQRLRRRGFVASRGGGPYRITRAGRHAVRADPANRVAPRGL